MNHSPRVSIILANVSGQCGKFEIVNIDYRLRSRTSIY